MRMFFNYHGGLPSSVPTNYLLSRWQSHQYLNHIIRHKKSLQSLKTVVYNKIYSCTYIRVVPYCQTSKYIEWLNKGIPCHLYVHIWSQIVRDWLADYFHSCQNFGWCKTITDSQETSLVIINVINIYLYVGWYVPNFLSPM
jgi:hypothetical protein